jgi:ketopantoate reductase
MRARIGIIRVGSIGRVRAECAKELAGGRPSLLQDVMRGRRTEVQYLSGYVSEQGRQAGILPSSTTRSLS